MNDAIAQINVQLPLMVLDEPATPLPDTSSSGVFGGRVTADAAVYLMDSGNAFTPVQAVTVHATGPSGSVSTPARLLSGVGAALHVLSSDAVTAFRTEALPRLSALSQTRTTIRVGTFYDLTVVVVDSSNLTFVFTPVGVNPPPGAESLGK
ncbi:MAG: hypothetical protein ABW215_14625 [Kibdelosporangium sp.]